MTQQTFLVMDPLVPESRASFPSLPSPFPYQMNQMKTFTMTQSTVHWEWPPTIQSISEGCQFQFWNASEIWTLLTLIISAAGTWTEPPPYLASIITLASLLICFHTCPIQYIVHFKARMMPSQCNSDCVISLLSVLQWHPPFSELNSQVDFMASDVLHDPVFFSLWSHLLPVHSFVDPLQPLWFSCSSSNMVTPSHLGPFTLTVSSAQKVPFPDI